MAAHTMVQLDSRRRIAGDEIWELAAAEYGRMLELLRTLGDGDWTRPTECPAWHVRAMLGHLVGAAEGFASPAELIHQYRLGAKLRTNGEADGTSPNSDGRHSARASGQRRRGQRDPESAAVFFGAELDRRSPR